MHKPIEGWQVRTVWRVLPRRADHLYFFGPAHMQAVNGRTVCGRRIPEKWETELQPESEITCKTCLRLIESARKRSACAGVAK